MKRPQPPLTRQDLPALVTTISICEADSRYAQELGDSKTSQLMRGAARRLETIYAKLSDAAPQSTRPRHEAQQRTYGSLGFDQHVPDSDAQQRGRQRAANVGEPQPQQQHEQREPDKAQPSKDKAGDGQDDRPRPTREQIQDWLPPVDSKGDPPLHEICPIGMPEYVDG